MVTSYRAVPIALVMAVVLFLTGCTGGEPSPTASRSTGLHVASYGFSESVVLSEVYAQALRRAGFQVTVTSELGSREIVEPALEQGHVDLVVDYLGSALNFVSLGSTDLKGDSAAAYRALREQLAVRGIETLGFAPAQDQNGFAVTARFASLHGLTKISDLAGLSPSLVFGGPSECPDRPYCLAGLESLYGLKFRSFVPIQTRLATAVALTTGEIDIGMLETTDARLGDGQLKLLVDDRQLQPPENLVPLVRSAVVRTHGVRLKAALAPVTAALTTRDLIELNREVEVRGRSPAQAAAGWLAKLPTG